MIAATKAYLVSLVKIDDADSYEEYVRLSAGPVLAFGAKFIVRGGNPETIEGSFSPSRVVILEFANIDAARGFLASPEYQKAATFRRQGADSLIVIADSFATASPT